MNQAPLRALVSLLLLAFGLPASAAAQQASLAAAEQAFVDLEYEQARELAEGALAAGGHDPRTTARLYELVGTSSALLQEDDRAYEAYVRLLAVRPTAEMDQSLPPQMRTAFLRARGWWASQGRPFGATVRLVDPGAPRPLRFLVDVNDPNSIGTLIELEVGLGGDALRPREVPAQATLAVPLDSFGFTPAELDAAETVQYVLRVRDARRNVLFEAGTVAQPQTASNPRGASASSGGSVGGGGGGGGGGSVVEEWWFWTIIAAVVVGGAAVGIYFAIPPTYNGVTAVRF